MNLNKNVLSLLKVNGKLIAGTSEGIFVLDSLISNVYDHKTESNDIQLFPNPVSDIFYIEKNGIEIQRVEIHSITGKLIIKTTDKNEINVSRLETGIYLYKIYSQNGIFQSGIIIKE